MKKMKLQTMVGLVLALSFGIAYAAGVPIHIDADTALVFGLLGTMGVFDTSTLLDVQRVQKTPMTFWLDKCFTKQINFETEFIAFDRVNEDYRRMAPFDAPNVQGDRKSAV